MIIFEIMKLSEIYPLELKDIFSNFIKEKEFLYPNFKKWFNKILIENYNSPNKREIFICINKEKLLINICGVMILKKYKKEKKICTLYIERNFRNKKIGSQMIKKSFEYLETNKPLITIPEEEYTLPKDEDNLNYLLGWSQGLLEFYKNALEKQLNVIFTVDL